MAEVRMMDERIELDMSGPGRIVEPPIVDFLAHDLQLRAFVAEFIPDPHVSGEQKESVYIHDGTATARRVEELLADLSSLVGAESAIVKVAHAGGDSFDFFTATGTLIQLHDSPSADASFDVYAILQVLSQEIQLEFLAQRRTGRVAG
jgi:hypothetical protein